MKKVFTWIGGFFDSSSTTSSKRLVGITGAGFLYWTLYSNSHTAEHFAPAESLVWGTVTLVCTSLGLATVGELKDMFSALKGGTIKKEEEKTAE